MRYTLVRQLGRGGMGVVWLARDEKLGRSVALKFLPEQVAGDLEAVADLKRETRRALELTHPRIVRIYDFIEDGQSVAISMEYVDGPTLTQLKRDQPHGVFDATTLWPWLEQLGEALTYAHEEARIIHRDLKPANLMTTTKGSLKVADFGIAATLSDTATRVSRQAESSGTPVYMSPQQMMGERPSVPDDIYALGATLYELLTGKPPFYSGDVQIQVQQKVAPSMAARREELGVTGAQPLPPHWETTIAACLAKQPSARPQSVAEVLSRLRQPSEIPAHANPPSVDATVAIRPARESDQTVRESVELPPPSKAPQRPPEPRFDQTLAVEPPSQPKPPPRRSLKLSTPAMILIGLVIGSFFVGGLGRYYFAGCQKIDVRPADEPAYRAILQRVEKLPDTASVAEEESASQAVAAYAKVAPGNLAADVQHTWIQRKKDLANARAQEEETRLRAQRAILTQIEKLEAGDSPDKEQAVASAVAAYLVSAPEAQAAEVRQALTERRAILAADRARQARRAEQESAQQAILAQIKATRDDAGLDAEAATERSVQAYLESAPQNRASEVKQAWSERQTKLAAYRAREEREQQAAQNKLAQAQRAQQEAEQRSLLSKIKELSPRATAEQEIAMGQSVARYLENAPAAAQTTVRDAWAARQAELKDFRDRQLRLLAQQEEKQTEAQQTLLARIKALANDAPQADEAQTDRLVQTYLKSAPQTLATEVRQAWAERQAALAAERTRRAKDQALDLARQEEAERATLARIEALAPDATADEENSVQRAVSAYEQTAPEARLASVKQAWSARKTAIDTERTKTALAVGSLSISSNLPSVTWAIVEAPAPRPSARTDYAKTGTAPQLLQQLPVGEYVVELRPAGGSPVRQTVRISQGATTVVRHDFLLGGLTIASDFGDVHWEILSAPDLAHLPTRKGSGTTTLKELPAGDYIVEFSRSGWKPVRATASVSLERTSEARVDFPSGGMVFACNAADATWRLLAAPAACDRSMLGGALPERLSGLPAGPYTVELARPGWAPVRIEVAIEAGRNAAVRYEYPEGSLAIAASEGPARWEILSGPTSLSAAQRSGRAPALLEKLPVGEYVVEIVREGWPAVRQTLRVEGGKKATAYAEFAGATLHLESAPAGAEIFDADGKSLGRTPLTLNNVKPGAFAFRLLKPGFEDATVIGSVEPRQVIRKSQTLKKAPKKTNRDDQPSILLPP